MLNSSYLLSVVDVEDYHDSLGAAAASETITPASMEAPILFERGGYYYLLAGRTCCFCQEGSGAQLWMAELPLGPWLDMHIDINPGVNLLPRNIPAQCNAGNQDHQRIASQGVCISVTTGEGGRRG